MKNSVSRSIGEVVWVGIRIAGLYFLVKGLLPFLEILLFGLVVDAEKIGTFSPPVQTGLEEQLGRIAMFKHVVLFLYAALGVYLLFFGKALHGLLTRVPLVCESEESEPDEQEESSTREMQRLYRDFMASQGRDLSESPKERHEQFRRWLADA